MVDFLKQFSAEAVFIIIFATQLGVIIPAYLRNNIILLKQYVLAVLIFNAIISVRVIEIFGFSINTGAFHLILGHLACYLIYRETDKATFLDFIHNIVKACFVFYVMVQLVATIDHTVLTERSIDTRFSVIPLYEQQIYYQMPMFLLAVGSFYLGQLVHMASYRYKKCDPSNPIMDFGVRMSIVVHIQSAIYYIMYTILLNIPANITKSLFFNGLLLRLALIFGLITPILMIKRSLRTKNGTAIPKQ